MNLNFGHGYDQKGFYHCSFVYIFSFFVAVTFLIAYKVTIFLNMFSSSTATWFYTFIVKPRHKITYVAVRFKKLVILTSATSVFLFLYTVVLPIVAPH